MSNFNKPISPVKPVGMEVIFFYPCPHCGRKVPIIGAVQPSMERCDACQNLFPIVPVDRRTLQYLKVSLADGGAAIDPDFM